ncbi:MAG: hypothetical protein IJA94_04635 [Bacilli bacterium]|nr:hypothetical protein [Bacilli bacterium]
MPKDQGMPELFSLTTITKETIKNGDFGKNNPFEKENIITQIDEIDAIIDIKVVYQQ